LKARKNRLSTGKQSALSGNVCEGILQFVANIHKIPESKVDEVIELVGITPKNQKKSGSFLKDINSV
jgi:ABC-type multidrug transport system ATPase subunit